MNLALEDASDIIYAVDNFVDEKKVKEALNSLTCISLAKGYYHLYGFNHIGCACWCCHLRNEQNKVVLTTSYKVLRMKKDNTYPFYEEWRIKKCLLNFYEIMLKEDTFFLLNF